MRFDRDRRGYETTALMHAAGRGGGKRLLYWFRTPPGVRVGRAPIDETAIRLLEQHNPDVEFDWTRILKAPPAAEGQGRRDSRDNRDRDQRGRREPRASQRSRSGGGPSVNLAPRPPARGPVAAGPIEVARPFGHPEPLQPEAVAAEHAEHPSPDGQAAEHAEHAEQPSDDGRAAEHAEHAEHAEQPSEDARAAEHAEHTEPAEPLEVVSKQENRRSGSPDLQTSCRAPLEPAEPAEPFEARPEDVGSASYVRLGAEGLVRLRARYAEVMARIAERPLEDEAREELKQRAERLNPDAWVTADEVAAALEQYETVFEGVRGIVGRPPRHRRRGRR